MDMTFDQMVIACKNIGFDLHCGGCAGLFFTGSTQYPHDDTCLTVNPHIVDNTDNVVVFSD